jgi:thymidylate kinase
MKKFIAVIGVAGAGKSTFIGKNYKGLPMQELNDDSVSVPLLFHDLINFKKAVLHITAFEDVTADFLVENILDKKHELHLVFLQLKDNEMQKERLRKRAFENKEASEFDVATYAYSKNVFNRTKSSFIAFTEKYKDKIKSIQIVNNFKKTKTPTA